MSPAAERVIDDRFGCRGHEALRERFWLGQQRPGPEGEGKSRIRPLPHVQGRHDVEHGDPIHALRMVES
jgi:hypothetical protein